MSEQGRNPHLPRVEEIDLNTALFEDITDTNHIVRWERVKTEQPELANEILKRAWDLSRTAKSSHDICRGALDLGSFVIAILEIAAERTASVGVGAEDQPPSGAPYDGQPADEPSQAPPDL
jgi:hypothetical protein